MYTPNSLGTHFDGVAIGSLINVTVQGGKTAFLNCKINLLQDKTVVKIPINDSNINIIQRSFLQVTWVRKFYFNDADGISRHELQLLTVGTNTFIDDTRYSVDFQYPNNFRLSIQNVSRENDEGVYLCQVFSCQNGKLRFLSINFNNFPQISTHPPKVMQFYLHVNGEFDIFRYSRVFMFLLPQKLNIDKA